MAKSRNAAAPLLLMGAAALAAWCATRPVPESAPAAAARFARTRIVASDVPYRQVRGWTGRVDIYRPPTSARAPVVVFLHGGGWVTGSKDAAAFWTAPFLVSGYAVAAVGYRLAEVAPAPAAIEDVRCALHWVAAHAGDYNLDVTQLVAAGDSAGGHLALMAGLLRSGDGFDDGCQEAPAPPVRAVVNLYGVTDVELLIGDAESRAPAAGDWPFAVTWIGSGADRLTRARRASPITWVRRGAPAVFTAHGTADHLVPYGQAVALHAALQGAGASHQLVTIEGGGHGDFTALQWLDIARKLRAFLARHAFRQ